MIEHDVNIYSFNDYVYFFEDLYLYVKSKNVDYSQRDFARDLGIPAPRINQILNRKEGLSAKRARELAEKIDLNDAEKDYFYHLVLSKTSKSKNQREISAEYIKKYNHNTKQNYLGIEKYSIIRLEGWDIVWNSIELEPVLEKLREKCVASGMTRDKFNEIVLVFIEEDLIGVVEGRIFKKKKNIAFGNSISSKDIRKYHISKLKESIRSLELLDHTQRKNESMTFTIRKEDYPILERRVEEFVDNLYVGLEETGHDELMTINVSLFPSFMADRGVE